MLEDIDANMINAVYYRASLSKSEKKAYDALREALLKALPSAVLPRKINIGEAGIQKVFNAVIMDTPDLFYVDGMKYNITENWAMIEPGYRYGMSEIRRIKDTCERNAVAILHNCAGTTEPYTICLMIHDTLIRNVEYYDDGTVDAHTIVNTLLTQRAVCEGFAKTYQYLLQKKSIPSIVVYGTLPYECSGKGKHAWNLVKINGDWIHVDVTADATMTADGGVIRYDYFAVSDAAIRMDHCFESEAYPIASSDKYQYYAKSSLEMNTREALREHITSNIRAGEKAFVFKLPDYVPEKGLIEKVNIEIQTTLAQTVGITRFELNYNIHRKVFRLSFGRDANV